MRQGNKRSFKPIIKSFVETVFLNVKSVRLNLCLDRQKVVFCYISPSQVMVINETTLGQSFVNSWSNMSHHQANSPQQSHSHIKQIQVIDR